MSLTIDDLVTLIGKQTIQIAALEAELSRYTSVSVEHKTISKDEVEAVTKVFN